MKRSLRRQRGQALAEAALVAGVMFLLMALGVVAIPLHRAHTAATAAVYACAQFITQYPNRPTEAANRGYAEAQRTLSAGWSALSQVSFRLQVSPPHRAGESGACTITYTVGLLFDPFGLGRQTRTITVEGRSERWKAEW